ncbi:hypothetical protein FOMPIDRAFT_143254, partial [Fomitopsis schrenkii]
RRDNGDIEAGVPRRPVRSLLLHRSDEPPRHRLQPRPERVHGRAQRRAEQGRDVQRGSRVVAQGACVSARVPEGARAAHGAARRRADRRGGAAARGRAPAGHAALRAHVRREGARVRHHPAGRDHAEQARRGVPLPHELRGRRAELREELRERAGERAPQPRRRPPRARRALDERQLARGCECVE